MKIAGLDIGTTGCKCTVFDESGKKLGNSYRDYPVRRDVSGHDIDVSAIMSGVYGAIGEMVGQYPDIAGIGVTSFGETFVFTDENGTPLHTSMVYTDPRGADECLELSEKLGAEHIAAVTGLRPHEMYSIPKMMYIRKHSPEIYAKARHAFLMEDYVVFHLTGVAQIDYSLATRTMAFDIASLTWSQEIFDAAGIDVSLMSKPVPTGTPAGCVTAEAARETGLAAGTLVVSISHDQVAAAVGAGAFDGSVAVDGAGTVECLTPVYDSMPNIDVMYKGYFSVVPYVIPGTYVAYAFSYTGGALVDWCVKTFAGAEATEAKALGISVNELLERKYEEHCNAHGIDSTAPTGLLVLPHFAGAATPYMDTGSKGAIIGLTAGTSLPEIYRACLEGVAYEMYLNYRSLEGSGIHFEGLNATGGGAHSKLWMQMKADVLNLPITALKTVDAGTVGSAMLTGIAIGLFSDLKDAAAKMVEETVTYMPDSSRHAAYMEIYKKYERIYEAVRPLV